ncbi:MAG TPA: site-specific integrase [Pseudolabrys sp.]|nr:site-specific integrase [Pseudolabrys sp.]
MPLKIYRRGQVWHYRGTVAGRRLRGSTGAASKEIALRVAADLEASAWKCRLDGPASVLSFAQAAIRYRAAGKPTRFLSAIEDYWKDTLVRDITAGAVRQAAITLFPNASGATRNRQVIVPTQAVINHAAEGELCSKLSVKRFPVESKVKTPVTWDWIEQFMRASPPHLGALACFMFLTGARVSEALALDWDDVDFEEKRALIRETKIGSERCAHLPRPLIVALANIERTPGRSVFRYTAKCSADKSWRAAVKRAGLPMRSFHCCRHGFATALLRENVDPVTIAKLGGWKSPQHVFRTYGHASDDPTITDRIAGIENENDEARDAVRFNTKTGFI